MTSKDKLKKLVLSDLYWWNRIIMTASGFCRDTINSQPHKMVFRWIMHPKTGRYQEVWMPRDVLKTHSIAISRTMMWGLENPHHRVLYLSENSTTAQKAGRVIRDMFEKNIMLHTLFPERIPAWKEWKSRRWSTEALELPRPKDYMEATFEFSGILQALQNNHYTHIVLDDVMGEDDKNNADLIWKKIEWFKNIDELCAKPYRPYWGLPRILITGYRWLPEDFYSIVKDTDSRFKCFSLPAEVEEKNIVFFPLWHPKEELDRMKQDPLKLPIYWSQIQNNPKKGGLTEFKKEWLQYFRINHPHKCVEFYEERKDKGTFLVRIPFDELTIMAGYDPAYSEGKWSGKAKTAIVVIGEHRKSGRKFLLECWAKHWGKDNYDEPFDVMAEYENRWHPKWGTEKWAQQAFIKTTIEKEFREKRKINIYFRPLDAPATKDKKKAMIANLKTNFANQEFYIQGNFKEPLHGEFMIEYNNYPVSKTVDVLDIISQLKQWWIVRKEVDMRDYERELQMRKMMVNSVTGY